MSNYKVTIQAIERQEWVAYVEADSPEEAKALVDAREFDISDDDMIEQVWNATDKPFTTEGFKLPAITIELED